MNQPKFFKPNKEENKREKKIMYKKLCTKNVIMISKSI